MFCVKQKQGSNNKIRLKEKGEQPGTQRKKQPRIYLFLERERERGHMDKERDIKTSQRSLYQSRRKVLETERERQRDRDRQRRGGRERKHYI